MGGGFGLVRKLVGWRKRSSILPLESEPVREGHVRVVVGRAAESEEVVVLEMESHYLNHPLMEKLLSLTGEEYGYSYKGALRIACDVHLFQHILQLLNTRNPCVHYMDLSDLISKFHLHS